MIQSVKQRSNEATRHLQVPIYEHEAEPEEPPAEAPPKPPAQQVAEVPEAAESSQKAPEGQDEVKATELTYRS